MKVFVIANYDGGLANMQYLAEDSSISSLFTRTISRVEADDFLIRL